MKWQFTSRTVEQKRGYVHRHVTMSDGALSFEGTPAEALEVAKPLTTSDMEWLAVSTDEEVPLEADWISFEVRERSDGQGWELVENDHTHKMWVRDRVDAVGYVPRRCIGRIGAVRVLCADGSLKATVLFDRREASC